MPRHTLTRRSLHMMRGRRKIKMIGRRGRKRRKRKKRKRMRRKRPLPSQR